MPSRRRHRWQPDRKAETALREWAFSKPNLDPPPVPFVPQEDPGPPFDDYDPADNLSRAISSPSRRDEDPLEEQRERYHRETLD